MVVFGAVVEIKRLAVVLAWKPFGTHVAVDRRYLLILE